MEGGFVGIWPGIEMTREWDRALPLLQTAADRGDGIVRLEGRHVWTCHNERGNLLAAATTRTTLDGHSEVELVGGHSFKRWLIPLRDKIEAWSRDEGMHAVRAYGRSGWAKVLDWDVIGVVDGSTVYERRL